MTLSPAPSPVNGQVSFWYADIGGVPAPRPSLQGEIKADVCIIGAGFTGLWAAYYLKKAAPELRIVVLEKTFSGYGASGRNGGWLSGNFSWSRERFLSGGARSAVIDLQKAMTATVDEVIAIASANGIDADIVRADIVEVATTQPQFARLEAACAYKAKWEVPAHRRILIDGEAVRARVDVRNAVGGVVTEGAARVQPAKLVRGLAMLVERMGVTIFEQSEVFDIGDRFVRTARGMVSAGVTVRATEGFTAGLRGCGRLLVPLNSAIVVTEPLSKDLWDRIGWQANELLSHASHRYAYLQRTREGRIAIGGRGVPYRFGSRTDVDGRTQPRTIQLLIRALADLFPQTAGVRIEHAWCGVLGVPRDWCASVGFDRASGVAWAGGYVGNGLSTSNLAGQTLADLILERDTALVRLPWVDRAIPRWEPEPFRWLGVHAMYRLYDWAERREARGTRATSRLAVLADRLTGR